MDSDMIGAASVYIEIANLQKWLNLMVSVVMRMDGVWWCIWTVNIWDTYQEVALYWVSA